MYPSHAFERYLRIILWPTKVEMELPVRDQCTCRFRSDLRKHPNLLRTSCVQNTQNLPSVSFFGIVSGVGLNHISHSYNKKIQILLYMMENGLKGSNGLPIATEPRLVFSLEEFLGSSLFAAFAKIMVTSLKTNGRTLEKDAAISFLALSSSSCACLRSFRILKRRLRRTAMGSFGGSMKFSLVRNGSLCSTGTGIGAAGFGGGVFSLRTFGLKKLRSVRSVSMESVSFNVKSPTES